MKFGFYTTTGRRLIYVLVYLHCFTLLITSYLPTQTLVVNCLMGMPDNDWSCTSLGLCVTICWPFQHDSNSNTIYIPEILGHLAKYPNPASLVFVTTLIWYRWHVGYSDDTADQPLIDGVGETHTWQQALLASLPAKLTRRQVDCVTAPTSSRHVIEQVCHVVTRLKHNLFVE